MQLETIQSRLIDVGSAIATPSNISDKKQQRVQFDPANAELLESWIDQLDAGLPPLANFILPSGDAL